MTIKIIKPFNFFVKSCCSCRRVLTGDGKWCEGKDLLALVEPRGLVSHGLCEECLSNLYPDMADKILRKYQPIVAS